MPNENQFKIRLQILDYDPIQKKRLYRKVDLSFDTEQQLKDLLRQHISNLKDQEIYIRDKGLKSSETAPKIIFEALRASRCTKVIVPPNFFTRDQNKQLKKTIATNLKNADKEISDNFSQHLVLGFCMAAVGVILLGSQLYFAGIVVLLLGATVMATSGTAYLPKRQREAKARYDTVAKINDVTNAIEQEALKLGVEAINIIGYSNEYAWPCWVYPKAYLAGQGFAEEGKKDIVKEINKLKPKV